MEIELSHVFAAQPGDLWPVLLDPDRISRCVPGMQSVEVLSDTEYNARIKVKIAFISAHFTLRTVLTEVRPPEYLRAEVGGQDNSIGSSVKAVAEMALTPVEGGTELRVTAKATVLGRLGALGLNPMRTKAERMFEQFCAALEALLAGDAPTETADAAPAPAPAATARPVAAPLSAPFPAAPPLRRNGGLFSWFRGPLADGTFRIELDRNGARVAITCPASHADQCLAWLDRQLGPQGGA